MRDSRSRRTGPRRDGQEPGSVFNRIRIGFQSLLVSVSLHGPAGLEKPWNGLPFPCSLPAPPPPPERGPTRGGAPSLFAFVLLLWLLLLLLL